MTPPIPTLLLVFAHPDDESYLAAGTVAKLTAEGIARVILVTATRGEAATLAPHIPWTRSQLAEIRAAELRRAGEILGVEQVIQLEHADGKLGSTDTGQIRRELTGVIRRYRPDVVLTFDPNGENLHPDHIAISRFASDAIAVSANSRWLPELGAPHRVGRLLWTTPVPIWSMLREPERPLVDWPGVDFVIETGEYWNRKREALLAHQSQRVGIDSLLLERGDAALVLGREAFRQAWGPVPSQPAGDDLFDGLETTGD